MMILPTFLHDLLVLDILFTCNINLIVKKSPFYQIIFLKDGLFPLVPTTDLNTPIPPLNSKTDSMVPSTGLSTMIPTAYL